LFRQLIGKQLNCTQDENKEQLIWQSLRALHNMGPSQIIISSISAAKIGGKETMLQMHASSKNSDNQYETFRIDFPYLKGCFTGTGDSFSALVLAWFHRENNLVVSCFHYFLYEFLLLLFLQSACEKSISILHQILLKTIGKFFSFSIFSLFKYFI
jgi:pyridoxal/pyridoxine/pyridoxamine kinase